MEELRNHLLERRRRPGDAVQLAAAPERQPETSAQMRRVIRMMRQAIESPPRPSPAAADGPECSSGGLECRLWLPGALLPNLSPLLQLRTQRRPLAVPQRAGAAGTLPTTLQLTSFPLSPEALKGRCLGCYVSYRPITPFRRP